MLSASAIGFEVSDFANSFSSVVTRNPAGNRCSEGETVQTIFGAWCPIVAGYIVDLPNVRKERIEAKFLIFPRGFPCGVPCGKFSPTNESSIQNESSKYFGPAASFLRVMSLGRNELLLLLLV